MPGLAYLDSSAMAKLLIPERESSALGAAILEEDGQRTLDAARAIGLTVVQPGI